MARTKPGRARPSGISLTNEQAAMIMAMVARGDRDHDAGAWFGQNQARVQEIKAGDYGPLPEIEPMSLPPSGSPGPKARKMIVGIEAAIEILSAGGGDTRAGEAIARLERARATYYKNE